MLNRISFIVAACGWAILLIYVSCSKGNDDTISNKKRYRDYNETLSTVFDSSHVNIVSNSFVLSGKDTIFTNKIPICIIQNLGVSIKKITSDSSSLVLYAKSQCLESYLSDSLYKAFEDSIVVRGGFGVDSSSGEITFLFPNITDSIMTKSFNNLMKNYTVEHYSIYVPPRQPISNKVIGLLLSFIDSNANKEYFFVEVNDSCMSSNKITLNPKRVYCSKMGRGCIFQLKEKRNPYATIVLWNKDAYIYIHKL